MDEDRIVVYFGSYGLLCYDHQGKLQWQMQIPTPKSLYGTSTSPILWRDLVILTLDDDANLPDSTLSRSRILALNKETGTLVWEAARPFHRSGWSTPTVWSHAEGEELVVLGNGRVASYDLDTGAEKWIVNGFSRETISRPIAGNGHVFASASMLGGVSDEQPDPEPFWNAIMQFDTNHDLKLQRNEMTGPFTFPFRPELPADHPGYGLPLPSDATRRQERLDGMFASIDRDQDGAWTKAEFLSRISFDRGKPNLVAIRPGGHGDITETHVDWALHRGIPEIPSPVLHRDRIYLVCDGGVLSSVDAQSGKVVVRKRLGSAGHYRASPVVANDHLYMVSENGDVSVVRLGDELAVVSQFSLGESVAATPAIDASTLYIRTKGHVIAFRDSGGSAATEEGTGLCHLCRGGCHLSRGGCHLCRRGCHLSRGRERSLGSRLREPGG